MAATAVRTERRRIHSYPEGLYGKKIINLYLERRATRKEMRDLVKEAVEVLREVPRIRDEIKAHNLTGVRQDVERLIDIVHKGLQEMYNINFEEALLRSDIFSADEKFVKKFGSQLTPEQKNKYIEFLKFNLATLEQEAHFLNELEHEVKGSKEKFGALNDLAGRYYRHRNVLSRIFGGLSTFAEEFVEGRQAKRSFKLEKKITGIEEKSGKLSESKIHELLKLDKEDASEFRNIMQRSFVYGLFLIRAAADVAGDIVHATSQEVLDIPPSYKVYADVELATLLNDMLTAVKSLNKIRLQLEHNLKQILGAL